jgi:hypothetical protein
MATSSSTSLSWSDCWDGTYSLTRPCIIETAFETTTGQRIWNSGYAHSRLGSEFLTPSLGRGRSFVVTRGPLHLQQSSETHPEPSWRWRESNPRPRATVWDFYERSRRSGLTSRLPAAEDLLASLAAMSGGGHQAEPPP